MENLTVTRWISEEESKSKTVSIGGLGGCKDKLYWDEYLILFDDYHKSYYKALRYAILEKGAITGSEHQCGNEGTPLFSDGTIAAFSFRAWGDLLSAIYNTKVGERLWNYIDFYYISLPDDERIFER